GIGGFFLTGVILHAVGLQNTIDDSVRSTGMLGWIALLSFLPNVFLGLGPAVFSWWRGQGLRSDFGIAPRWRDLGIGLACGGLSLAVGLVLNAVLRAISPVPAGTPPLSDLLGGVSGRSTALALFALFTLIGAPLTEELLMRGALWGALEHYRMPRYAILALTALIFAFLHQEPDHTIALICQGLAIGSARMITGRTSTSMIAHATNNLIPALTLFFAV
ncbi:MAG: lysostaphin resistance A-like protein, partial [Sciscionella sp.]